MKPTWQPSASIELLKQRAAVLRAIREFFFERNVMEVDSPSIMPHSVTDPYMTALKVQIQKQVGYLQTSPEYAMKRLIAAGIGDCYQLGKNFRAEEIGRKHQPEFCMLEWYRMGWDHHQLMQEVAELIQSVCNISQVNFLTYKSAFVKYLLLDPFVISDTELRQKAEQEFGPLTQDLFRDDYLSLLFAERIEPKLGFSGNEKTIDFVFDFPASQSSLAKLIPDNLDVAGRFEVFVAGTELANGFWELTDPMEQRKRFEADNKKRMEMGVASIELDESLLGAIEHGLPECSGVALGVDRLMMFAFDKSHINDVIAFPWMKE